MTNEEIEEQNNLLRLRRRSEEDHDNLEAEVRDMWADVDTEQATIALEDDAEDDLFLATELSRDYVDGYAEVEEIPEEKPLITGLDWDDLSTEDEPTGTTVSSQESKFNGELVKKEFAKAGIDFADLGHSNDSSWDIDALNLMKWWAVIMLVLLLIFSLTGFSD